VGEDVEDIEAGFHVRGDGLAVPALVEEKPCLLTLAHVDEESRTRLLDLDPPGDLPVEDAVHGGEPLAAPRGRVGLLVDSLRLPELQELLQQEIPQRFPSQRVELQDEVSRVVVDDKPGQIIGLGMDQPAGIGRAREELALPEGCQEPLAEEVPVDLGPGKR